MSARFTLNNSRYLNDYRQDFEKEADLRKNVLTFIKLPLQTDIELSHKDFVQKYAEIIRQMNQVMVHYN